MPKHSLSDSTAMDMLVNRIERLETQSNRYQRRKKSSNFYNQNKKDQCAHCLFLNKQLGSNLRTDLPSSQCGKSRVSVSLVESLGHMEPVSSSSAESHSDFVEGEHHEDSSELTPSLQTSAPACSSPD